MFNKKMTEKMQLPKLFDFEIEAQILLKDGGIKNKPFKMIQEASNIIKEKIDNELESVFYNQRLTPDFFIGSKIFQEIYNEFLTQDQELKSKFQPKIGLDFFKMALFKYLGGNSGGIMNDQCF